MWIPPGEYILDRLEGETAVLEGEDKLWDIPRQDQAETQARKQRMAEKMRRLFGKEQ